MSPGTERAVGWGRERKQHAGSGYHRKFLLRKRMLRWAPPGPVYLPFCGDGDLAVDLYSDRFVLGADLEEKRVQTAEGRLTGDFRVADVDEWPFPDWEEPIVIADFDAWANPYRSLIAFWDAAPKAKRLVVFGTDGLRIPIMGDGRHIHPNGDVEMLKTIPERQRAFYFHLAKTVRPWFEELVKPYRVLEWSRYLQGQMAYWGCAIERKQNRPRRGQASPG